MKSSCHCHHIQVYPRQLALLFEPYESEDIVSIGMMSLESHVGKVQVSRKIWWELWATDNVIEVRSPERGSCGIDLRLHPTMTRVLYMLFTFVRNIQQ